MSSDVVAMQGYKFFRKDRDGRDGGVKICIKDFYKVNVIFEDLGHFQGVEYLIITIDINTKHHLIIVTLRVPNNPLHICVSFLDNLFPFLSIRYEHILLLGDLNVDHFHENALQQFFKAHGFETEHSPTLLGVLDTNNLHLISSAGTLDLTDLTRPDFRNSTYLSHLNIPVESIPPKFIKYSNFKRFSENDFLEDLTTFPWVNVCCINDIEQKVSFIRNGMLKLFDV